MALPPRFLKADELGGVKDVVVFDPATLFVLHARRDGTRRQLSPQHLVLECGCEVTV